MLIFLVAGCGVVSPRIDNEIDNEIVYRALLIGVGDYIGEENDLASPTYSVDMMHQSLANADLVYWIPNSLLLIV